MRSDTPNQRLRQAIADAGHSIESFAHLVGFTPKQVGRWVRLGVIPRRVGAAQAVANALGVDEASIWPHVTHAPHASSEVVAVWSRRADVPLQLWRDLIRSAIESLDVLVFAALWLPESHPDLAAMLQDRARAGLCIRLLAGDPDSDRVAQRGMDEGIGPDAIGAKIRNALTFYSALAEAGVVEVRLHDTTLYASLYRADSDMVVNPHIWGLPAAHAPAMQLRRDGDDGVFSSYQRSFERIWEQAKPWWGAA